MELNFIISMLFFLLCSMLFVIILTSFRNGREQKLPPGPWKLPIIGSLHHLGGSPAVHRRFRELSEKYGPLMHVQLGGISTVVVSSAETAEQVLKTKDHIFGQRPLLAGSDIVFYGPSDMIMSPTGDHWKLLRKIFSHHLFNAARVRSFGSAREEEVTSLMKCLSAEAGSEVNFTEKIFATACRMATRSAFGEKHKDQVGPILGVCNMLLKSPHGICDLFPSQKWLQVVTGVRSGYVELRRKIDRVLENIIADHHVGDDAGEEEECLLSVLLNLQRHGDLTTDNVKAAMLDVILAGFDSPSRTVEWAMAEMVRKPTILRRAQEEVRQVLRIKGHIDESALQELKYLKAIFKETLRLHPPSPLLAPRECTQTCEINGYTIPERTQVFVNVWAITRDPKYWSSSSDTEEFVPERFMNSSVDYRGSNFEFIPFGAGKRGCPGMLFGLAIGEILLAHLLCYFDWKLPFGKTPGTLDMTELMDSTLKKKNNLILVPTPHANLVCT
ncbi:5-epiaristolochene 1,3-dihydroxylase-like [Prosopis cineraria]|uniref:5-epiaristolochene 1,3-dihydroxylase-like n=1 Tax=Prosopis cineraria TaxID=364024 RepID=UPI002410295D|nr:5-epiaristolochene 1,3-dihydroxylase-like [Prosopis cineraria]